MLNPVNFLHEKIKQHEAKQKLSDYVSGATELNTALTYGPFGNNLSQDYAFGQGSWNVNFLDKLNPDIVIIFLSKMCLMYRQANKVTMTLPIRREVKDILLKDNFPHHISKAW